MESSFKCEGYLKFPDIKGFSETEGHEDEVEVYGVEFTMAAPYEPGTMAKLGRVSLSPVKFYKTIDKASPLLMNSLFNNMKQPEVVFAARRTVEDGSLDYFKITMRDAFVMNYKLAVSDQQNGALADSFELSFKEIEFEYDGADPQIFNVATK